MLKAKTVKRVKHYLILTLLYALLLALTAIFATALTLHNWNAAVSLFCFCSAVLLICHMVGRTK